MVPTPGRIVRYTLSEQDVAQLTYERSFRTPVTGNPVSAGDQFPLVITRVFAEVPTETTAVNGQVLLDGPDTLWVTSRLQGDASGQWSEYPRV